MYLSTHSFIMECRNCRRYWRAFTAIAVSTWAEARTFDYRNWRHGSYTRTISSHTENYENTRHTSGNTKNRIGKLPFWTLLFGFGWFISILPNSRQSPHSILWMLKVVLLQPPWYHQRKSFSMTWDCWQRLNVKKNCTGRIWLILNSPANRKFHLNLHLIRQQNEITDWIYSKEEEK